MKEIIVYKTEEQDGLSDKIRSSSSIAFVCAVEPCDSDLDKTRILSQASEEDSDILYPIRSILVSTNWNQNDDVFLKEETWAARHTPKHKPTNLNHKKSEIVGHITDTWAIDVDGNLIADDTPIDDLPNFHLCNGSVIYKYFPGDDEMTAKAEKLISQIEAGKKYVSMECLFPAFDYALASDNKINVVPRNKDTSFLTKHLARYGGEGEYDGMRLGRVLRNIEFSGKGYVDQPANPHSIIFTKDCDFEQASIVNVNLNEVLNKRKTFVMASNITTEKSKMEEQLKVELETAKKTIESLSAANKELNEKISAISSEKFEKQITELKIEVSKANDQNKELSDKVTTLENNLVEANKQLEDVTKAKNEAESKVKEAETAAMTAKRISVLVDGGVAKDAATSSVEKFASLNDEQFEEVAKALIAANKPAENTEESTASEDTATDTEIIDEAKVEESADAGSTSPDDNDSRDKLIEGLASYFTSQFENSSDEK